MYAKLIEEMLVIRDFFVDWFDEYDCADDDLKRLDFHGYVDDVDLDEEEEYCITKSLVFQDACGARLLDCEFEEVACAVGVSQLEVLEQLAEAVSLD